MGSFLTHLGTGAGDFFGIASVAEVEGRVEAELRVSDVFGDGAEQSHGVGEVAVLSDDLGIGQEASGIPSPIARRDIRFSGKAKAFLDFPSGFGIGGSHGSDAAISVDAIFFVDIGGGEIDAADPAFRDKIDALRALFLRGELETLDDEAERLLDGTFNYYSAVHERIETKINGDTAVLVGCSRVEAAVYGGRKSTWHLQGDFTLRKEEGTWKFTSSRASTY